MVFLLVLISIRVNSLTFDNNKSLAPSPQMLGFFVNFPINITILDDACLDVVCFLPLLHLAQVHHLHFLDDEAGEHVER